MLIHYGRLTIITTILLGFAVCTATDVEEDPHLQTEEPHIIQTFSDTAPDNVDQLSDQVQQKNDELLADITLRESEHEPVVDEPAEEESLPEEDEEELGKTDDELIAELLYSDPDEDEDIDDTEPNDTPDVISVDGFEDTIREVTPENEDNDVVTDDQTVHNDNETPRTFRSENVEEGLSAPDDSESIDEDEPLPVDDADVPTADDHSTLKSEPGSGDYEQYMDTHIADQSNGENAAKMYLEEQHQVDADTLPIIDVDADTLPIIDVDADTLPIIDVDEDSLEINLELSPNVEYVLTNDYPVAEEDNEGDNEDEESYDPFEELDEVLPPKVDQPVQPGADQLLQAKQSLGIIPTDPLQENLVGSKPNFRKAYALLHAAVNLGNNEAKLLLGSAHLTGDHIPYVSHNISRAMELYSEAAKSGLPSAQRALGALYATGIATDSSQSKALLYYMFAALGGDTLARMSLAFRYWSGFSVAQSCESALKYYTLVADTVARMFGATGTGQVVLRIRLMEEEQSPQNSPLLDEDLVQYYQFLADKGDLQAQLGLGQLYLQGGRGIDRNTRLAQHYFNLAAKAGNTAAYGYLGKIAIAMKEYDIAWKYFKLATKDALGQWGLGTLYYHGWSVTQDYKQALTCFKNAAAQGHTEAELQLGLMHLSGVGVKKDYGIALKHFNLASKAGHVLAFYNLGMMHASGVGVMRNCQTAAELLKNVAERGMWSNALMDAHALYHRGYVDSALVKYLLLAEYGFEVAQTNAAFILDRENTDFIVALKSRYQRAFVNWKRAAVQGFGGARLKLGDYYYYGQGTEVDASEAAEQYQLASDIDSNPQAMFNLGFMHETGVGRQQDVHLAKRYYDMAATTSTDAQIPVLLANSKLQAKVFLQWLLVSYKDFTFAMLLSQLSLWVSGTCTAVVELFSAFSTSLLELETFAGEEWDIYLMTILAVILGLIMAVRGHQLRAQLQVQRQRPN